MRFQTAPPQGSGPQVNEIISDPYFKGRGAEDCVSQLASSHGENTIVLGNHDEYCVSRVGPIFDKDGNRLYTYRAIVRTSYWPPADDDFCYRPQQPLHTMLTEMVYFWRPDISTRNTTYVGAVAQAQPIHDEGGPKQAGIAMNPPTTEVGLGFYWAAQVSGTELNGTTVGSWTNVKWTISALDRNMTSVETWVLFANGEKKRPDLHYALSEDGTVMTGMSFLINVTPHLATKC
jgi:hypothetical protein